jgi:hypothetical protein
MIAIICTDGQLDIKQIENECVKESWIPLLTARNIEENKIYIPIFNLAGIAYQFCKRNLPQSWYRGCVLLSDDDIAAIIKNGWEFMPLNHPRKLNEHPNFELGFEIHDFKTKPDFKVS